VEPEDLAREARLEQAAEARARRGLWDRLAADEASLAGTLARGGDVVLGTAAGRVAGAVAELGTDHCAVAGHYLRLDAIETLRVGGPGPKPVTTGRTLREVLARRAGTGEPVTLQTRSGDALTGSIESVGDDVVALRRADPEGPVYVSLSSVVAARVGEGSG
jgi:hypothetical protein